MLLHIRSGETYPVSFLALQPYDIEDHVWVHLIESVPSERKELDLIGEHLMAFACKRSMELGFEGAVAFQSKKKRRLMLYYVNVIGASYLSGGLMVIDEPVAERLVMLYLS